MSAALAVSFAAPLALGVLTTHLLWPGGGGGRFVRVVMGAGLGMGISSCLFFFWRMLPGVSAVWLFAGEWAIVAGLACCAALRRRGAADTVAPAVRGDGAILLATAAALALGAAMIAVGCLGTPNGEWDTLAIWNQKARFLFRGGEHWTDMFLPGMDRAHRDYPLLVPGAVARAWTASGADTATAPMILSGFFGLATAGLLCGALRLLRGDTRGLLGTLALLATPAFVAQTAFQYADVPLAFYVLAGVVLFAAYERDAGRSGGIMALAGLAFGLGAWTKNEGLLLLCAAAGARAWVTVRGEGLAAWRREAAYFAVGAAPALAAVLALKLRYAGGNELVTQDWGAVLQRAGDLSRWGMIARKLLMNLCLMAATPGVSLAPIGVAPLLAAGLALCGVRAEGTDRRALTAGALTLGATLAGYVGVYVATPHALEWHLDTSLGRLVQHLWPATIFLCFMAIRPPGESASLSPGAGGVQADAGVTCRSPGGRA